jgi:hypothetical protein
MLEVLDSKEHAKEGVYIYCQNSINSFLLQK